MTAVAPPSVAVDRVKVLRILAGIRRNLAGLLSGIDQLIGELDGPVVRMEREGNKMLDAPHEAGVDWRTNVR